MHQPSSLHADADILLGTESFKIWKVDDRRTLLTVFMAGTTTVAYLVVMVST